MIRLHGLRSQELDFVPSAAEIFRQWQRNRFGCIPRNVDLFVAASGDYLYCYNDVAHRHPVGHVGADAVAAVLRRREGMAAAAALCEACNMRHRYGPLELLGAGLGLARARLREG